MTHRELIRSSDRTNHSEFRQLPEELQDRIIDGLDAGELTYQAASAEIKAAGFKLSFQSVWEYYRAVKRERRLTHMRDNLARLVTEATGADPENNRRALLNLVMASAIQGLADGEIKIRDLDLARIMALTPNAERGTGNAELDAADGAGLTDATADAIREKILTGKAG